VLRVRNNRGASATIRACFVVLAKAAEPLPHDRCDRLAYPPVKPGW
jgi:hypothetical protein